MIIQDEELVWRALADYRLHAVKGNSKLVFPDALVLHTASEAAELYGETFGGFYTFDGAAREALQGAKSP